MLKLIPRENTSPSKRRNKKIKTRIVAIPKLQQKLDAEMREENQTIKSAYLHLVNYIHKAGSSSLKEMGELIHSLQRSVLSLEKKRTKILRKQGRNSKQ